MYYILFSLFSNFSLSLFPLLLFVSITQRATKAGGHLEENKKRSELNWTHPVHLFGPWQLCVNWDPHFSSVLPSFLCPHFHRFHTTPNIASSVIEKKKIQHPFKIKKINLPFSPPPKKKKDK
jgi:hypothetical protein